MTDNKVDFGGSEFSTNQQQSINERKIDYFESSLGSSIDKQQSLMRYMSRQDLAKLLCYADIYNMTSGIAGNIVECGVYYGNGLMTFAKLCASLEPYNYNCKVIGFDTFEGNQSISEKDHLSKSESGLHTFEGGYEANTYDDLKRCIEIFDMDRPLNQFPKVELVKGNICQTAPEYIENNQQTLVRILSLTMNLYEPTKAALKAFLPRMSKGSVIMPFTLNSDLYPGMTLSILDELNIKDYQVKTMPNYPNVNYIVL
ncbi:TylF/MycF/NovP-related O-methyltransferase [Thalassotalea euphylliae]|uniref:Class I SAM-dependent methyltransferase n=1 Tax=Thalassotalea euphylliae TaxID=1655234 RepID=A0A3E0UCT6_9GAMM|nr:TylF/MycF/NovP-related O-methyltransferase [Thalassotalea euphylliae]REL34808.1 class I SAM-dependent methyltransferase [Thalassotalea euphylliae]